MSSRQGRDKHAKQGGFHLAQPDPPLPEPLARHGRLGNDRLVSATPGMAGPGHRDGEKRDADLRGTPGLLAPGTGAMATRAANGPSRAVAIAPQTPDVHPSGSRRLSIFLISFLWLVLVVAGIDLTSRAQGEIMGQALPAPMAVHRVGNALRFSLFDLNIRLPLPQRAWAALSLLERSARQGGDSLASWLGRHLRHRP
jgi:hypothetical protein